MPQFQPLFAGSISLDEGAQPRQRRPQVLVLDRGQGFGDLGDRLRVRRAGGSRPVAARQRRLAQRQLSQDRKSTRLNSSHSQISYAVFCLKKKKRTLHPSEKKKNKRRQRIQ